MHYMMHIKHPNPMTFSEPSNKSVPYELTLEGGDTLMLHDIIRIIPHRRLVAIGEWQHQTVIAKLFFDKRRALKDIARETTGIRNLEQAHIPTPKLYYEGNCYHDRCGVLLFEYLKEAKTLSSLWEQTSCIDELIPVLKRMMIELATQHVYGILQKDLHFKNFLIQGNLIYTLDGASVKVFPKMLRKETCLPSLALFLSQLGVGLEPYQMMLYRHYALSRGWQINVIDEANLLQTIEQHHQARWMRYRKKIFRNSTDFLRIRNKAYRGMAERAYLSDALKAWFDKPDAPFTIRRSILLKEGRSTTVAKVTWHGRDYVIKRNNIKHFVHFLKRLFRTTRAAHAWEMTHKLKLFGVSHAHPVAFLEKRFLCFTSHSYFVSEYIPRVCDELYVEKNVERIVTLFKNINKLNLSPLDLKLNNILVNEKNEPLLIDMDSVREHRSSANLSYRFKKGIKRFLKNFDSRSDLYKQLKAALQ